MAKRGALRYLACCIDQQTDRNFRFLPFIEHRRRIIVRRQPLLVCGCPDWPNDPLFKVRIYAPKENFGVYGFSLPSSFYRKDESLPPEQLPACYGVVWIEPYAERPSPRLRFWRGEGRWGNLPRDAAGIANACGGGGPAA